MRATPWIYVPVEGNADSPVRVIAYEDLECGDCAVYRRMLDNQLLPTYGRSVAFEYRAFPLPKHEWARQAAIAERYLGGLNPQLGTAFRQHCYARQRQITLAGFTSLLGEFAIANGADRDRAVEALSSVELAEQVDADRQEGTQLGVVRTPTVFVNGEPFVEKFSYEQISRAIEVAVAREAGATT